jgi:hypothetical protein
VAGTGIHRPEVSAQSADRGQLESFVGAFLNAEATAPPDRSRELEDAELAAADSRQAAVDEGLGLLDERATWATAATLVVGLVRSIMAPYEILKR